jgi:hypothetical protein
MIRLVSAALISVLLAGCIPQWHQEYRRLRAEADIAELYKACLSARLSNPALSCDEHRVAFARILMASRR